jgi:hypothetical protein
MKAHPFLDNSVGIDRNDREKNQSRDWEGGFLNRYQDMGFFWLSSVPYLTFNQL